MNSTKLIVTVFAAAAVVIGGCSGDNRITGPGADVSMNLEMADQIDLARSSMDDSNLTGLAEDSQEQRIERFSFEATVKKSDVEGGCLYLETDKSERYTPYFGESTPGFRVGQRLFVFGYIDENMNSYCMIGDVFHVEKYTNIARNDEASREAESKTAAAAVTVTAAAATSAADENQPISEDARPQEDANKLRGYFGSTEKGCFYIEDEKGIIAELYFVQRICPDIQNGASVVVEGAYSLLAWSPCQMAPLFNVEKIQVEEDHLIADNGTEGK